MKRHPERVAWTILLIALAIFCALAVIVPWSIRWYIINATVVHPTALTAIRGTVLVETPNAGTPIGVRETMEEVPEGSIIKTDATSQAFLTLFEDSTVTLYNETQVVLLRTRSPRFGLSPKPDTIILLVKGGRVRIGVAPAMHSSLLDLRVQTPHAEAKLEEGAYSLEATNERSQVVVRCGRAAITAAEGTVILTQGERATIEMDQAPVGPLPAERNLVVNGDFSQGLSLPWIPYNLPLGTKPSGMVEVISDGDRQAVHFLRGEGARNHCETGIRQRIDKDVRDFASLKLHLGVQLVNQSLPGGGYLSSEFPIIVRLDYKDLYGNDQFWTHGFYYKDPIQDWPILNGEKIPPHIWYPYESGNLMESEAKPVRITSISIYASGWEYESLVSNVELLAEE